ncbi:hypothetical protein ACOI22_00530 [Glaciecola sp. 2405UD65-10]|uniref:hypothetical protein n=1 Tax=Glaciecola sp. 2405UD65-10 TaxID=3397244 RepID=UPI003B5A581C
MLWYNDDAYVRMLTDKMLRSLLARGCSIDDAKDVAQTVLIKLFRDTKFNTKQAPIFDEGFEHNWSYLFRMCQTSKIDLYRDRKDFRYKTARDYMLEDQAEQISNAGEVQRFSSKTIQLRSDKDVTELLERQSRSVNENHPEQWLLNTNLVTFIYPKLMGAVDTVLSKIDDQQQREFLLKMLWDDGTSKQTVDELALSCGFDKKQPRSYFQSFAKKVEKILLKEDQLTITLRSGCFDAIAEINDLQA